MKGALCLTPGCGRRQPRNNRFCGRCWRAVPMETKLALDGHHDAVSAMKAWGVTEYKLAWREFVAFSWQRLLDLAALQAWAGRHLPAPPMKLQELAERCGTTVWDVREVMGDL